MREARLTVFNAVDASIDETSAAINAEQMSAISAIATVTGTSTGTLAMQVSNDAGPTPANWVTIPSATAAISGANTYIIPTQGISYEWVRIIFTHTNAAAGTLTVSTKSDGY